MKISTYHSRDVQAPDWTPQCWWATVTDNHASYVGHHKRREQAIENAYRLAGLEPPERAQGELFD